MHNNLILNVQTNSKNDLIQDSILKLIKDEGKKKL